MALLLDRTAAARGGRRGGLAESAELERVVSRLDGLPLAIELAAARLRVLSASQLAERLDDVLGTLDAGHDEPAAPVSRGSFAGGAGGHRRHRRGGGGAVRSPQLRAAIRSATQRHATMQATVTWSYRTLGPRAARLLRWLSVFSGPVDLGTVEWLLDDDPLDPLAVLVDKSMIQVEPHGAGSTYRMLDPIRAYAARRLVDAGEEQAARDRHVAWCAARPPAGVPRCRRPAGDAVAVRARPAGRRGARGAAVDRDRGQRPDGAAALAGGLDQWWRERGLAREGRLWLFRLYGRIAETGESIPDAELAAAYHMHSQHAGADGEFAEELRFSQRAEAAARQAGDAGLLARILSGRAAPLIDTGRLAEAERISREVTEWANGAGVASDALYAVFSRAELLWHKGALDEAAELLGAARPAGGGAAGRARPPYGRQLLGMVALARGDLVAAHDHLVVALRSRMAYGFRGRACDSLNAMAVRCAQGGDPTAAARLFGAAQATRLAQRGSGGLFAGYWAEEQAAARAVLGDGRFDAAYAEGAALTLEDAVAEALAVEHPDLAAGSSRFEDEAGAIQPPHPRRSRTYRGALIGDPEPGRRSARRDLTLASARRAPGGVEREVGRPGVARGRSSSR